MAKTFVVFDNAILNILQGDLALSNTFRCYILDNWTPDYATSTIASVTAAITPNLSATASGGRAFASIGDITRTAAGVIKFTLPDITFTASSGTTMTCRYGLVAASATGSHDMVDAGLLGYWEISSADIAASQLNLTMPTDGLFDTSAADKTV